MYRVDGSSDLARSRSTTSRATGARGRCASATAPPTSCSWTSTARRCSRCSQVGAHRDRRSAIAGWKDIDPHHRLAGDNWDQPDEGIWETRGGRRDFTYGRVMSLGRARPRASAWRASWVGRPTWRAGPRRATRSTSRSSSAAGTPSARPSSSTTAPTCWTPRCWSCRSPASSCRSDPMWLSTLDAIEQELVSDSLVYRYNPSASPDGLTGDEGTFSICTFWYVDALARSGRLEQGALRLREDAHLRQPPRACSPRRSGRPASSSATSRRRSATCR